MSLCPPKDRLRVREDSTHAIQNIKPRGGGRGGHKDKRRGDKKVAWDPSSLPTLKRHNGPTVRNHQKERREHWETRGGD